MRCRAHGAGPGRKVEIATTPQPQSAPNHLWTPQANPQPSIVLTSLRKPTGFSGLDGSWRGVRPRRPIPAGRGFALPLRAP